MASGSNARSLRDATTALQNHFTGSRLPLSLPSESRRMLQSFIDDHNESIDQENSSRANEELKQFWNRYIGGNTQKLGAFMGVLKEFRIAIVNEDDLVEWYQLAAKPIISQAGFRRPAVEDAQEFLASVMIYDDDAADAKERARTSQRICNDLIGIYVARTHGIAQDDKFVAPDNHQIVKQVETALIAFGKKMPKQLFYSLDDLIVRSTTRLQGLTLLSSFLQHQAPHLYQVIHTPLVDHLLKCLMNDTSTTILSVALTSLIMLLPHIPGSLNSRLPRLFLVYSRLLCWEKFSPLSTEAQKSLVTDDRMPVDENDSGDVGIDPTWEKARPPQGTVEPTTPELMTYFTYLYGMYPLNFMSYIRKPRRFLKNAEFPGADDFDLDQAVIRSRSDQFRQVHFLHPNFYNSTIEEEMMDPKWPKMDPADVVAECHSLAAISKVSPMTSPGPPPTTKLPDLPPIASSHGAVSPAMSHGSFRSGNSWRDNQSTAVVQESPVLGPSDDVDFLRPRTAPGRSAGTSPTLEEFPLPAAGFPLVQSPKDKVEPRNNMEYLQQRVTGLQNELNFERWHKAQYSTHISQLTRKNVKDATVEAETLNLINANRALKQQLEQVRNAREATIKDSTLTRKQASNLESNLTERFNKMKKEQETWAAEADELKRLRSEMKHYRELLSTSEKRELTKSHELEVMKRDLDQLQKLQTQLLEAQRKLRQYEFKEFDFEQGKHELQLVQSEKETLLMRLQRQDQDRERTKKVFADRIAELEAQIGVAAAYDRPLTSISSESATQQALDDTQAKLAQLRKTHSKLREQYMDLELEYSSVRRQLAAYQGDDEFPSRNGSVSTGGALTPNTVIKMSGGLPARGGVLESEYGVESEYGAPTETSYTRISTSDPNPRNNSRQAIPISPVSPSQTAYTTGNLSWKPPSTSYSTKTRESDRLHGFNITAPLRSDERSLLSGQSETSAERREKEKITANSEVRVYGRGGAQNIKMKEPPKKGDNKKGGGFKALKGIAGL